MTAPDRWAVYMNEESIWRRDVLELESALALVSVEYDTPDHVILTRARDYDHRPSMKAMPF